MHIFHKWGKWEQYTANMIRMYGGVLCPKEMQGKEIKYDENRQKRQCSKCGKIQDEEV